MSDECVPMLIPLSFLRSIGFQTDEGFKQFDPKTTMDIIISMHNVRPNQIYDFELEEWVSNVDEELGLDSE